MAKKTGKKKSAPTQIQPDGKTVTRERADQERTADDSDEANPFDFGGLPARDLKKNLGCG